MGDYGLAPGGASRRRSWCALDGDDGAYAPRHRNYGAQRRYFDAIADTPGVQLRLGHIQEMEPAYIYPLKKALEAGGVDMDEFSKYIEFRKERREKGVDTLITLDLVRLAQRRAYDTALPWPATATWPSRRRRSG